MAVERALEVAIAESGIGPVCARTVMRVYREAGLQAALTEVNMQRRSLEENEQQYRKNFESYVRESTPPLSGNEPFGLRK